MATGPLIAAPTVLHAVDATAGASIPSTSAPASSDCQLGNGIQRVIEITFDNVHFNRDNPNVLSDLEQMPALENFITGNGTILSNNHTPLIAHTADDTITNYTGLYGDRQGMGISNTYETYTGSTIASNSAFAYWTGSGATLIRISPTRRRSPPLTPRAAPRRHLGYPSLGTVAMSVKLPHPIRRSRT